jgi:hypothetical protein
MMPAKARLLWCVAVGAAAAAGCAASTMPELELGRLSGAEVTDEPEEVAGGLWAVAVRLVDRSVAGRIVVLVEFDAGSLRCVDGTSASVGELAPGTPVQVERTDRLEVLPALPPTISGSRLVVDCR